MAIELGPAPAPTKILFHRLTIEVQNNDDLNVAYSSNGIERFRFTVRNPKKLRIIGDIFDELVLSEELTVTQFYSKVTFGSPHPVLIRQASDVVFEIMLTLGLVVDEACFGYLNSRLEACMKEEYCGQETKEKVNG